MMRTAIYILFTMMMLASCSANFNDNQREKSSTFYRINDMTYYSEWSVIEDLSFTKQVKVSKHKVRVRILRTDPLNTKQVRQSFHEIEAQLIAGKNYHIESTIKDELLQVWLVDNESAEVVSSIASIRVLFEKTFVLKKDIQDENRRIRVILMMKQDEIAHVMVINKRKPLYEF